MMKLSALRGGDSTYKRDLTGAELSSLEHALDKQALDLYCAEMRAPDAYVNANMVVLVYMRDEVPDDEPEDGRIMKGINHYLDTTLERLHPLISKYLEERLVEIADGGPAIDKTPAVIGLIDGAQQALRDHFARSYGRTIFIQVKGLLQD